MLGVMLQIASFSFTNVLKQLDELGFFAYVLPFLLIFAVIYAILTQISIFKDNRGASVLVAAAIGLLSLQLNFVPAFFQTFFPKVGIGLALLLVALILAGAFIIDLDKKNTYKWIFFGLGTAIFLVLLILQFSGRWWNQYGALIIVAAVIIVAMIMVIVASKHQT